MHKPLYDEAQRANDRLIALVANYYNQTRRDLEFYRKIDSELLQELTREHLRHWKRELRSLIFNGLNCQDERSER